MHEQGNKVGPSRWRLGIFRDQLQLVTAITSWHDDSSSSVQPCMRPAEGRPAESSAQSSFSQHCAGETTDGTHETASGHGNSHRVKLKPFVYCAPTPDLLISNELQYLSLWTNNLVSELVQEPTDVSWVWTIRPGDLKNSSISLCFTAYGGLLAVEGQDNFRCKWA